MTPSPSWSSQYAVAALPATDQASRGDKIILPHSALGGLLSAFRQTQPSEPSNTTISRLWDFPDEQAGRDTGSLLQEDTRLPHPLTFRLYNPENGKTVWAGVREFSAEEGFVHLTPFLLQALALKEEDLDLGQDESKIEDIRRTAHPTQRPHIQVQAQQLPKGKHVRLRPLEAGYIPDNWKPLLEREFGQRFTTLTKDAIVSIQSPAGGEFKFLVDKVVPFPDNNETAAQCNAICVVDTDLEVDIEALDEEQARETVRRMMEAGNIQGGEITTWAPVQGTVCAGEYVDYTLSSWLKGDSLEIQLADLEDSTMVDLFVSPKSKSQRALPRAATHVFGVFDGETQHNKRVLVPHTHSSLQGCELIMISVHRYTSPTTPTPTHDGSAPTPFTLSVRTLDAKSPSTPTAHNISVEEMHSANDEQCRNCRQWVPKQSILLHENFCRRNNFLCPLCQHVFKKGSAELDSHWHCEHDSAHGNTLFSRSKHNDVYHTTRTCSCGTTLPSLPSLAAHRTTVCPDKLILCRFCHLDVPQEGVSSESFSQAALKGMTEHEFLEGSKTTNCHLCKRTVRLFDLEMHLALHEKHKASLTEKPVICSNVNCGHLVSGPLTPDMLLSGTIASVKPTIPGLDACPACSSSLQAQVHDPEAKALMRRIERRYLQQLMTGCAKTWCQNEWCRTGRVHRRMSETGKSMKDTMPFAKLLLQELRYMGDGALSGPLFMCADEKSTEYRKVAERIREDGIWGLEWAVAAADSVGGDIDMARQWLKDWAPTEHQ